MKKLIVLLSVLLLSLILLCSCGAESGGAGYDKAPTMPDNESSDVDNSEIYGEKVIKNATVTAETKNYENATDVLEALIKQYGGHVYSSDSTVQPSYYDEGKTLRHANYTIKIPAQNFDEFLDSLAEVLNITRQNTSTVDAADEYYDLESVISTYKSKRQGLVSLLEGVDKNIDFKTWQEINKQLTELDIEIARYEAQLMSLQNKIDYSTVSLSVTEVAELTATEEIGYGQELLNAISESLQGTLEFFKGLLIVIIYLLPFNVICGVTALIIVLSVRKGIKKRRAAQQMQSESKE